MANRAKHAFGMLENIDEAILAGKIDSYDILFVKDAEGKPYVGWIDKEGNKVICDDSAEFSELLEQIATKASADEVSALEEEIAKKVTAEEVNAKIDEKIAEVNSSYEIVEF